MSNTNQKSVNLTADGIAMAATKAIKSRGPAPVHLWNPPYCGDLDMRIARDGTWYYLGTPIGRKPLVKLFSSILRKDGDNYFLVTPVEKVGITVDDAPFVAIDFEVSSSGPDQQLLFTTQVDDTMTADKTHKIRVEINPDSQEPSPYILVRNNLEALIDRKSFYRLVELGTTHMIDNINWFGVWSCGEFFGITPSEGLPK